MKTVLNFIGCLAILGGILGVVGEIGAASVIGGIVSGFLFLAAAHVIGLLENIEGHAKRTANAAVAALTEAAKKDMALASAAPAPRMPVSPTIHVLDNPPPSRPSKEVARIYGRSPVK